MFGGIYCSVISVCFYVTIEHLCIADKDNIVGKNVNDPRLPSTFIILARIDLSIIIL